MKWSKFLVCAVLCGGLVACGGGGGSTSTQTPPPTMMVTPPGSNQNTAILITLVGSTVKTVSGSIASAGANVWYTVAITGSGMLTAETTGTTNTFGTLIDSSDLELAVNSDSGASDNFKIIRTVTSGTHYIRVNGYDSTDTGNYSLRVSFEALTSPSAAPDAPTLTATLSTDNRSVTLTWTALSSTSAAITSYQVQRATGTSGTFANVGTTITNLAARTYTESAPAAGTYRYRVQAINSAGSRDSAARSVTFADGIPDLRVVSPFFSDSTVTPGQTFAFSVTVQNDGSGDAATTLRYYRSTDETITSGDTAAGTDTIATLSAGERGFESISLTAPNAVGTYYYGACVDRVAGETKTDNNCSSGVRLVVSSFLGTGGIPDLRVVSPSVSDSTLTPGQTFTFSLIVQNDGSGDAAATTLRYYRSTDGTISRGDTAVNTSTSHFVGAHNSFGTSIGGFTAPSALGTYYYGACVDSAIGETKTDNNCSSGVRVVVSSSGTGSGIPDLRITSSAVSDTTLTPGQTVTFSVTVQNTGSGDATATILRAGYFSGTSSDNLGTSSAESRKTVAALGAGESSNESFTFTAPTASGPYIYGACADTVTDETNTGNNCSDIVYVAVSSSGTVTPVLPPSRTSPSSSARNSAIPITLVGSTVKTVSGILNSDTTTNGVWYRVAVSGAGTLTAETTGFIDTRGSLFKSSSSTGTFNDDGGTFINFRITSAVTSGTYYIGVFGFDSTVTGNYSLRVSFTPTPVSP